MTPLILIAKSPPLIFEGNLSITKGISFVTALKGKDFEFVCSEDIVALSFIPNLSTSNQGYFACPYPASQQRPVSLPSHIIAGNISFEGNKIRGKENLITDGSSPSEYCDYAAYFVVDNKYSCDFSDKSGSLYSVKEHNPIIYEVSCDDCCGEDEYLLESSNYPGWKCVPTPPIANRLGEMQNQIKKL